MNLIITSLENPSEHIEDTISVTLPTKSGIITILPWHVPLLSAIGSGVMIIVDKNGEKRYAVSGWVLETDGKTVKILTEMAESSQEDAESIRLRKLEAERLMKEAKEAWDTISMEKLIELEAEYQKDAAREQLAMGSHRN